MNKTVNYTSMFKSKLTFRISFKKFVIPYTFEVEQIIILAISVFVVVSIFGGLLEFIGEHTFLNHYVVGLGLAYMLTRLIQSAHTDGKRIDQFLVDMFIYFAEIVLPKKVLHKGKLVNINRQPIVYTFKKGAD